MASSVCSLAGAITSAIWCVECLCIVSSASAPRAPLSLSLVVHLHPNVYLPARKNNPFVRVASQRATEPKAGFGHDASSPVFSITTITIQHQFLDIVLEFNDTSGLPNFTLPHH